MLTFPQKLALIVPLLALPLAAAESTLTLWEIGTHDQSGAEFALANGQYKHFLERFGKPENAYYIGLSDPATDWPHVLPGPLDNWSGSARGGRWDQMNTLSIGFVLSETGGTGDGRLIIDLVDTHPRTPPQLRVTINGEVWERDLPTGDEAGVHTGIAPGVSLPPVLISFPSSLLHQGYNEISLRNVSGSWLVFDDLRLETPESIRLAEPLPTVLRSVQAAPYAVSDDPATPATLKLEVYQHHQAGRMEVQVDSDMATSHPVSPGLQVLEIPVPASAAASSTVQIRSAQHLLAREEIALHAAPRATPADYVDPFAGTAHARWMIAPGPWMPFGMVKLAPDNRDQGWCAGYDYALEHIDCFSHIHEWTMAGLGMMPTTGPLRTRPGLEGTGYSSRIDHSQEQAGIGFYRVPLKDSGIRAELTATTRAGLQRYTFPRSDSARIMFDFLIPSEYPMEVLDAVVRKMAPDTIEGTIQSRFPDVWGGVDQRFHLHFVAQFSKPADSLGGWQGAHILGDQGDYRLHGDCGIFANFATTEGETLSVRTGLSLVSVANARQNLDSELSQPFGWDFEALVRHQREVWNQIFSRVQIETPDAREKTRFYSNLYRAFSGRNIWSDSNGEWVDEAGKVHRLAGPDDVMLGCDAFWNTFWNLNQVMNLLTPEWSTRWVRSQLELFEKCGWLAKGPAGLRYIPVMVAEHEIPLMVAAYQHGTKGVDGHKVLEAALKMQTTPAATLPGGGRAGNEDLASYVERGYVAWDAPEGRKATSDTLEYAYDDWTVAQLARALGREEIAERFSRRANNWRHVFDAESGFMRPRGVDGSWLSPFDPYRTGGFVEGNAWQFTWFVPHDVPALVEALGRERFLERLNHAFEISAPTRFNAAGEDYASFPINHGNQPTMQVGWLFNWAGAPWLTQRWVGEILNSYYGHGPADAYLGDEDQGQMSAWFVMSSLGLFQTDGGARIHPIYEIGSPLYPKITLQKGAGSPGSDTFVIEAPGTSPTHRYIQSATLDDKALNRWWITRQEFLNGHKLFLEMGPEPNQNWAADAGPPPNP